jgi:hypothetical protein
MITWKLWSALHHPPVHHPVFLWVTMARNRAARWQIPVVALMLLVGYGCYQASFINPPVYLVLFSFTFQDILVIFVTFNLIYGCILTAGVGMTIARAREGGIYDVLCMTPSGAPGINWAMCTGVLYRRPGFSWFRFVIVLVSAIPMIALLIHIAVPLTAFISLLLGRAAPAAEVTESYFQMLLDLSYALALIIAFYTGTIQSIILSLLTGMLTSSSVRDANARAVAAGFFLLVQLATYLLTFIFGLVILPAIYQTVHAGGWLAALSIPLFRLAFFFALREGVNVFLWRRLLHRLNDEAELHIALAGSNV